MSEVMSRVSVPALDAILGQIFPVLDKGFVRVVDYMGGDASIVQAARVSYGKGTKKISEDEGLIRYLLRHCHTSPVEMCQIKFHLKLPMDCNRQLVRHRTAKINEYSTRYSEAIDDKQQTLPTEWRLQATDNKQGSGGALNEPDGILLSSRERAFHAAAVDIYQERLKLGVAKEQARKDLPLSTYTELYWNMDLHNLLHFLSLRMDSHAQKEIREYANVIGNEVVSRWVPLTWAAFNDYNFRRNALLLTARDKEVILHGKAAAEKFGWMASKSNRERQECESKLVQLGLPVPWQE